MIASPSGASPVFDLSLLPPASRQFLVISDTHYLLPGNAQAAEWASINQFPVRTERALRLAGALPVDFSVHLGDVAHEYPETGRAQPAREAAKEQFRRHGLRPYQAAGNMDIGDKPDPTSPADWVSAATLAEWHATFGPSWHSFDHGDLHGVVLNTQIMNGLLPEAEAQQRWAEADLQAHAGRRLCLFLHMPPYFVEPTEPALGFYNSLDEPARGWLLDLIRRYRVALVFAGHTHFVALNRLGPTRLYVAPSTATSRAGLAEAFTVCPPDQGRGDEDKLGFYLVRLDDAGASVHLIRSGRDTPALDPADPRRLLLTRTSRDLPHGRLGIVASHPLGHVTPGPIIWPSIVRQPVRDDWRLLALLELGARLVRVPASDLDAPTERERLASLRDEGVSISAYWLWAERLDLAAAVLECRDRIDAAEIVLPGLTEPSPGCLRQIAAIRARGVPVTLAPALRGFSAPGQYHPRTRVGYRPAELAALDDWLARQDAQVDRVAVRLYPGEPLWETVPAVNARALRRIGAVDVVLDFASQEDALNATVTAEAVAAVATVPDVRLVLGPLLDLDRSMDIAHGLLDRLSNPRSAFHVARCLNSLLFSAPEPIIPIAAGAVAGGRQITLVQGDRRLLLLLPTGQPADMQPDLAMLAAAGDRVVRLYDLVAGWSEPLTEAAWPSVADAHIDAVLARATGPLLLATGDQPETRL